MLRIAVLIGFLAGGAVCAQPAFEVASVRPTPPPDGPAALLERIRGGPGSTDPGRITATHVTLKSLLSAAYDVSPFQIRGPDLLDPAPRDPQGRYEIVATVPSAATKETVKAMWRNLLAERFGLVLHHESRSMEVWNLVPAKNGTKLTHSNIDASIPAVDAQDLVKGQYTVDPKGCVELNAPGIVNYMTRSPSGTSICHAAKGQSLAQFAAYLSDKFGGPVLDRTGLAGTYDFTWTGPAGGVGMADAIEAELGLKLVKARADLDILFIDKVNNAPTEN